MAERDVNLNLKLLVEGFKGGLNTAERQIGAFASKAKHQFDSVGKSVHNIFSGKFSFFGGAIAGAAIYETIRKVGEFDDSVRRLAGDANMSTGEMLKFKQQILDTSMKLGVSTEDLTGMSKAAYKASHDMGFVNKEFEFMAKYAQASGASAEEVGKAMGELSREIPADQLENAMKFMGAFGTTKGSRMTAKELMPELGSILRAAQIFIKSGEMKNANKMIAEAEFSGSPQAVKTAYMSMHRYSKKNLRSIGILQGMSLTEGIAAVFANKRITDKMMALEKIFGRRTLTGLQPLITDAKELAKDMEDADKIDFMSRADMQSKSFGASMNRLGAAFMTIADTSLAPVLEKLTEDIGKMDPEAIKSFAQALGTLATFALKTAEAVGTLVGALTSYFALPIEERTANKQVADLEGEAPLIAQMNKFKSQGKLSAASREAEVISGRYSAEGNLKNAVVYHKLSVEMSDEAKRLFKVKSKDQQGTVTQGNK